MRKIKSYKNFSLNESLSFADSEEYEELINRFNKKDKEEILEYFYEVTDDGIMNINVHAYIGETDTGKINNIIDEDKEFSIFYIVDLSSKDNSLDLINIQNNVQNLKKVSENLLKLSNVLETFKNVFQNDLVENNLWGTGNKVKAKFRIRGEQIDKNLFYTFYKKWRSGYGKKYDEGLKYLIDEYAEKGIENPPLTSNDTDELLLIGFYLESEIIVVATYDKKKDIFRFDWGEFNRSIDEWREENAE